MAIEELAVTIRKELAGQGLDHGPVTVRWHLQQLGVSSPAVSTLARIFTRRGMVTPQPQKRPRSSYRRFEFAMVHECWQIDAFEWPLTTAPDQPPLICVIYQVLDDRSRFMLATRVGPAGAGENSADAIRVVDQAIIVAGQAPCLFLSDNGVAFNRTRLGRTSQLVTHLKAFGTRPITGARSPQTRARTNEHTRPCNAGWPLTRPIPRSSYRGLWTPSTRSTTTAAAPVPGHADPPSAEGRADRDRAAT